MRPSIASSAKNWVRSTFSLYHNRPVTQKLLLISYPAEGKRLSWPEHAVAFSNLFKVDSRDCDCVAGVGGHGGSGIHADLDDKYREIVTRVSNYSPLRQPHPVVAVSPRRKTATGVLLSTVPTAAVPRPAAVDRGGGPPTDNLHADRGGNVGGGDERAAENPASSGGGASARRAASGGSGTGQVQPASVTKCAVCSILWPVTVTTHYTAAL